jgi:SpoVK/Ycf46/Vps4 family AAA+-type ATPase
MLRAGRFDKLFYTDLPSADVRQQIFEVHFKKRGVTVESLQFTEAHWARITTATDRFVGAEIEEVVRESRYRAMEQRGSGIPEITEVLESIASITPMARTESEAIEAMRLFCKSKGSPVTRTSPDKKVVKRSTGRTLDVRSNPSDN